MTAPGRAVSDLLPRYLCTVASPSRGANGTFVPCTQAVGGKRPSYLASNCGSGWWITHRVRIEAICAEAEVWGWGRAGVASGSCLEIGSLSFWFVASHPSAQNAEEWATPHSSVWSCKAE